MQICSIRIYMITFICCLFVKKTVKDGNAEFSFIENVYLGISEACRALSDPLTATEADVLESQQTVSVMHIEGNLMTSYPIYKYIASVKDISVKYYLISKSLNRNDVNLKSKIDSNDDFLVWIPINETIVKRDVNMTKWVPIDETIWHPIKSEESHRLDLEDIAVNWFLKEAIKRPNINVTRETKIIIHGFGALPTNEVTLDLAMAYHNQNLFNVLLIDAEVMFGKVYFKCVRNAQLIGKALADVIIYLESFGAKAADFHLIGVSLGAHAAGWAGKYYRHFKGQYLGRITGLDPAGPCFTNVPSDERLDKTDALYVDVIHSNSLVEGLFEPIGHADFFLNGGGPFQPGCIIPFVCCHLRAAYVYTDSISRADLFVAVKCDSWTKFKDKQCFNKTAILGHASASDTRGVYYLRTTGQSPYGLGMDGIRPNK